MSTERDPNWQDREVERLVSGHYKRVPWDPQEFNPKQHKGYTYIVDQLYHYPHVSRVNPELMAYTESPDKGERDVKTRIKPGRYLKKFYPRLPDETVAYFSAMYGMYVRRLQAMDGNELKFAKTADEIENVYTNGPHSCMAYKSDHPHWKKVFYSLNKYFHPTRLYAGFDLQIAYTDETIDGRHRVTARTVVWPEKKVYVRIYGDGGAFSRRLEYLLDEAGYSLGNLEGARITRLVSENMFILPYIDGDVSRFDDMESFLRITENGKFEARCQYGYVLHVPRVSLRERLVLAPRMINIVAADYREDGGDEHDEDDELETCERCGNRFGELVDDYCDDCWNETHETCQSCDEPVWQDEGRYCDIYGQYGQNGNEEFICDNCLGRRYVRCVVCDVALRTVDNAVKLAHGVIDVDDGTWTCRECWDEANTVPEEEEEEIAL